MSELDQFLEVCQRAVRLAGATLQDWIGRTNVRYKGPADLVTEADLASQEVIRQTVLGAFPDHSLLGEEGPIGRDTSRQTEYRWVADPLDGTTNFVHRVPHYCVSLALERAGNAVVGAVFDPNTGECFTATAGQGATLNGQKIRTSEVARLSDALAVANLPAHVTPESPDLLVFLRAVHQCQAIRRTGSAALNLCYLAAGRFDVLWAFSTKIWDLAAGTLIVREAGGVLTSPEGGPFVLDEARCIAAATPALHAELREMVAGALREPRGPGST